MRRFREIIISLLLITATTTAQNINNIRLPENLKAALVDDFLVNDDVSSGRSEQRNPSIAIDANNNFIIAYQERKHGNWEVYFQRFNSDGTATGLPVKCSDNPIYGDRWFPSIAIDASGNFVVVWADYYNGKADIFFQRYNSAGVKQGSNVKVNDVDENVEYTQDQLTKAPRVCMSISGNFIVTWNDIRNSSDLDIYFQRYNSLGVPLGTNQKANNDLGNTYQYFPAIGMDNSENFVITWSDYRNGNFDIYFQRFNASGNAIGTNQKVNDDVGTRGQSLPVIAVAANGSFIISWVDNRNGTINNDYDLYLQQYNSSGAAVGANRKVNDQNYTVTLFPIFIKMNAAGDFIISWIDERREVLDLYLQIYNSSVVAQGANRRVSDDTNGYQWSPSVDFGPTGNFKIVWQDVRQSDFNIYLQSYDALYTAQGVNVKIIEDQLGTADQYQPSISNNGNNRYVVAWYDDRTYGWNPFFQLYNLSGVAQGTNQNASTAVQNSWNDIPGYIATTMDGTGEYIIAWEDGRNGNYDIYYQRFTSQGNPSGINTKVNSDVGTSAQYSPAITRNNFGNHIITWFDNRNNNFDIYFQIYNSLDVAQGTNTKANDDVGTYDQVYPQIASDPNGNFTIVWEDYRNGNADIYLRRFNSDGTALGTSQKVNDNTGNSAQRLPSIAIDGSGNAIVVWYDKRNGNYDIYTQRYNSAGIAQGANQKVNEINSEHKFPKIAVAPNGNYVITWTALVNNLPDIYAQRFYSNGTKMGSNTLIVAQAAERSKILGNVSVTNGNVLFTWMDNRRQTGWDIYSKILTWSWGDVPNPALPQAPSNLNAVTYNTSQINLSWQDNDVNEMGIKIERKIGSNGSWELITDLPPNTTSFQNTNLIDGTTYYYRVFAYNNGGSSLYSNESSATTWLKGPTNLRATPFSTSQIDLTWQDNSGGETSYIVQRKTSQQDPFVQIAVLPPNTQNYSDQNLINGTTYYYRIGVASENAATVFSEETSAMTYMNRPTDLIAIAITNTRIDLSWKDNSNNEHGFKVERKIGSSGVYAEIGTSSSNVQSYSDLNLAEGTEYFYRVCAYYGAETNSEYSNEASATTTIIPPQAPTNLTAQASTEGFVLLNWKDNSLNESGFIVERQINLGTWYRLATTEANVTSYKAELLSLYGAQLTFRVCATNLGGNSAYSNEVSFISLIPAPLNLTATAISSTHIRLTWILNFLGGIKIERKKEVENSFSQIAEVTGISYYNNTELEPSTTYYYRVKGFTTITESNYSNEASATTPPVVGVEQDKSLIPEKYFLANNYPNPFNSQTSIEFGLPATSVVSVFISNLAGQIISHLVYQKSMSAGKYKFNWDGNNIYGSEIPSGIYFVTLTAHGESVTQQSFAKTIKVTFLK